jgi:hypothetical protein
VIPCRYLQDKFNADKVDTLSKVYKKLTGKDTAFLFSDEQ